MSDKNNDLRFTKKYQSELVMWTLLILLLTAGFFYPQTGLFPRTTYESETKNLEVIKEKVMCVNGRGCWQEVYVQIHRIKATRLRLKEKPWLKKGDIVTVTINTTTKPSASRYARASPIYKYTLHPPQPNKAIKRDGLQPPLI